MNPATRIALPLLAVAALAAGGGYWLGQRGIGQDGASATQTSAGGQAARQPLYYRNPMGLPDTSPTPKKDPMGMDYIPVYADEETQDASTTPGGIKISSEKVQQLGVRTEAVRLRALDRLVRAAGRVEPDERRMYAIAPKFEGYVERLHVNVTGQPVRRGQPLFEAYSPELVSAQREYAIAAQGGQALQAAGGEAQAGMGQLAEASLVRLRNWDVPEAQIQTLAKSGAAQRNLTFRSPVSGIVTEKKALQGMRFMPGETLYQVTDLGAVWVVADVFEQDIGLVKLGAQAKVRIDAYPERVFSGRVSYVYPTLAPATRTVPVRIELANPGGLLKPAMYAQVELPVGGARPVPSVPDSAVIDSGTRSIVLVQTGEGQFEPRPVRLGGRGDNYVEVLEGVAEGEQVVVAANFLIDAESNLKAALAGLGGPAQAAPPTPRPAQVGHQASGTVDEVDPKGASVSIEHGPVASLKWPAMTMEFQLANPALLQGLKPGAAVEFEFVERQPGEWVITRLEVKSGTAQGKAGHAGH